MGLSRRTVIIGSGLVGAAAGVGGWAALADARIVPGRSLLDNVLGRCDIAGPPPPEAPPGLVVRNSFYSQHRNQTVGYALSYPPKVAAGAKLPVCLVLHGHGGDEQTAFDELRLHRLLAAIKTPPFVLATVSGGDGYWHPHPYDDPLGMLLNDFPRVLRQHGLPTDAFAVMGWSMGGYGAILAATEAPKRFVAVTATAPAIWESFDEARRVNAEAFDSAEQWQTWGDLGTRLGTLPPALSGPAALRIDCGESDSFQPALSRLAGRLPDPRVLRVVPGCHDTRFFRSVAPAQLALIGAALTPQKNPKKK